MLNKNTLGVQKVQGNAYIDECCCNCNINVYFLFKVLYVAVIPSNKNVMFKGFVCCCYPA